MYKALVFDMDGTIVDLYSVNGWLQDLRSENPRPYKEAKPLVNMEELNNLIKKFKEKGFKIIVTTWLSMGSSKEYDHAVRKAKKEWLKEQNFNYDEIHLIKYGTTKADCTRKKGGFQILIDDNEKVRKGWHLGATINAKENIVEQLQTIL